MQNGKYKIVDHFVQKSSKLEVMKNETFEEKPYIALQDPFPVVVKNVQM